MAADLLWNWCSSYAGAMTDQELIKLSLAEAHAVVQGVMSGYQAPWFVAGGWALDFWRNRQTRFHSDLEVSVFRCDLSELYDLIKDRRPLAIFPGPDLRPWTGEALPDEVHQLRIAPVDTSAGAVEFDFFLNPNEGDYWVSRRDPRLTLPLHEVSRPSRGGTPVLAPEVVLLFKAKHLRPKDLEDFNSYLPRLDARARAWLKHALELVHPGHEWIARLATAETDSRR